MALAWTDRMRVVTAVPALRMLLGMGFTRRWLARARSTPVEGQVLDEHLAAIFRLDDLTHDSVLIGLSPPDARRSVARGVAIVDRPGDAGLETRELEWQGPAGARPARLYVPPGSSPPSPGLLYVHGGGWVTGDLDTHDALCRKLARHGEVRVLSIDYRLAPEHPFPAAVDDAVAAFRWAVAHAGELGLDPARIGVGGDSAGGNLAAVIGLRCGRDAHPPALSLMLYPALDGTLAEPSLATFADGWFLTRPMIDWYYEHYAGKASELRRHPDLSPLLAPDVSAAAPALILPAHFDPLRDEALRYAERLAAANVPVFSFCYPTFSHGFALMTRASPAAARAIERIARAVGQTLRSGHLPVSPEQISGDNRTQ